MKLQAIAGHKLFRPALGAALAVLCGVALWQMPLGERWVNASYDYLFRFGAREVNIPVVVILMDNEAFDRFDQVRGEPWNRAIHAELLNRLADDKCPLVVVDSFFEKLSEPAKDTALAEALRRLPCVVLMAELAGATLQHADEKLPNLDSARLLTPVDLFLGAVGNTNWGVAWHDEDLDRIVRRHWPFPVPRPRSFDSLPWAAARLAGAKLDASPQWVRYYGPRGAWTSLSYAFAGTQVTNYFSDKIAFIGNKPATTRPADGEVDEFQTPYTRWTDESAGGVEILATEFLNLMNGDWLRRMPWPLELLLLIAIGLLLGFGLGLVRPLAAIGLGGGLALALTLGAVTVSHFTNYWFPWLVIVGGQLPCALGWSLLSSIRRGVEVSAKPLGPTGTVIITSMPDTPDYELFDPPFGEGGFGKVWLARNAIGQWQALKAVYQSKFGKATGPYEAEFKGIERYKPVSEKHPGLLRIDFVSRMKPEGYFYYVMELGDGQTADWQSNPTSYKPWDLTHLRARSNGGRVPVADCVRVGLALTEALDFLHRQGLTHRDIKPSNVIFVNGRPKLADIGLVSQIRSPDQIQTYAGTPGYMPPPPEPPGTVVADIYALGMLLYVTSTGREPAFFPNLSTTLMERTGHADFIRLNAIILKACQPDSSRRYTSAAEMYTDLQEAHQAMEKDAGEIA